LIGGADVFLDTNILLYAALGREHAQHRFEAARRIVLEEDYCTSAQVLAEFYVNVQKKGARPLSPDRAAEWIRVIAKKPCQAIDDDLVRTAIALSQRYRISYWDAGVVAAAERLGAETIYSEDLNHGQVYGAVKIINPFVQS